MAWNLWFWKKRAKAAPASAERKRSAPLSVVDAGASNPTPRTSFPVVQDRARSRTNAGEITPHTGFPLRDIDQ